MDPYYNDYNLHQSFKQEEENTASKNPFDSKIQYPKTELIRRVNSLPSILPSYYSPAKPQDDSSANLQKTELINPKKYASKWFRFIDKIHHIFSSIFHSSPTTSISLPHIEEDMNLTMRPTTMPKQRFKETIEMQHEYYRSIFNKLEAIETEENGILPSNQPFKTTKQLEEAKTEIEQLIEKLQEIKEDTDREIQRNQTLSDMSEDQPDNRLLRKEIKQEIKQLIDTFQSIQEEIEREIQWQKILSTIVDNQSGNRPLPKKIKKEIEEKTEQLIETFQYIKEEIEREIQWQHLFFNMLDDPLDTPIAEDKEVEEQSSIKKSQEKGVILLEMEEEKPINTNIDLVSLPFESLLLLTDRDDPSTTIHALGSFDQIAKDCGIEINNEPFFQGLEELFKELNNPPEQLKFKLERLGTHPQFIELVKKFKNEQITPKLSIITNQTENILDSLRILIEKNLSLLMTSPETIKISEEDFIKLNCTTYTKNFTQIFNQLRKDHVLTSLKNASNDFKYQAYESFKKHIEETILPNIFGIEVQERYEGQLKDQLINSIDTWLMIPKSLSLPEQNSDQLRIRKEICLDIITNNLKHQLSQIFGHIDQQLARTIDGEQAANIQQDLQEQLGREPTAEELKHALDPFQQNLINFSLPSASIDYRHHLSSAQIERVIADKYFPKIIDRLINPILSTLKGEKVNWDAVIEKIRQSIKEEEIQIHRGEAKQRTQVLNQMQSDKHKYQECLKNSFQQFWKYMIQLEKNQNLTPPDLSIYFMISKPYIEFQLRKTYAFYQAETFEPFFKAIAKENLHHEIEINTPETVAQLASESSITCTSDLNTLLKNMILKDETFIHLLGTKYKDKELAATVMNEIKTADQHNKPDKNPNSYCFYKKQNKKNKIRLLKALVHGISKSDPTFQANCIPNDYVFAKDPSLSRQIVENLNQRVQFLLENAKRYVYLNAIEQNKVSGCIEQQKELSAKLLIINREFTPKLSGAFGKNSELKKLIDHQIQRPERVAYLQHLQKFYNFCVNQDERVSITESLVFDKITQIAKEHLIKLAKN